MHPKILRRVIGHEGDRLEICPAVLMVSQLDLQLILTAAGEIRLANRPAGCP